MDHSWDRKDFDCFNKQFQSSTTTTRTPKGLVGENNEVDVRINGHAARALLDTGSTVATVSRSCYEKCMSHIPIIPLNSILNIQCCDGQHMPYRGYIEASIYVPQVITGYQSCIFLLFLTVLITIMFPFY